MFTKIWHNFKQIDYKYHLFCAFLMRVIVIQYGSYHDSNYSVPFTDVDYKVFTDAARHVLNNTSPYKRHTYRYSPFVAFLLIPNILVHQSFGKILFACGDIIVALLIRLIVKHSLNEYGGITQKNKNDAKLKVTYLYEEKRNKRHNRQRKRTKIVELKSEIDVMADISMSVWLYNPMAIAIATRGNCDSIAGLLVLTTLYILQCRQQPFLAGLCHGLAVHVRLYPLMYSLALFMHLSKFAVHTSSKITEIQMNGKQNSKKVKVFENKDKIVSKVSNEMKKTIFKLEYLLYLVPNFKQLQLIAGTLLSVVFLTCFFYFLYGFEFLHESYLYHFTRKDTRHNFSLYFYMQYLTADIKNIGLWPKVLTIFPQLLLLLVFSVRYGLNKLALNFAILTVTIAMVIYNTVLTSQYFVWVLVILPLCLWQIHMSKQTALILLAIWFVSQGTWLLPAYFLEFQGHNTFMFIWIQSISLFCANIVILGRLVKCFVPTKLDFKVL